jgi:DNA-binding XRE family transcriptional regulator
MDKITLAAARVNAEYTIEEAAAEVGKSPATVSAWENYINEPKVTDAKKLAKLYGRSVDTIAWTKEDKE